MSTKEETSTRTLYGVRQAAGGPLSGSYQRLGQSNMVQCPLNTQSCMGNDSSCPSSPSRVVRSKTYCV